MIPFTGELKLLKASKYPSYTLTEISRLVCVLNELNLKIVPFIETFDNLEYILKHDKYKHLREQQNNPSSICLMNPDSLDLICKVID